MTEALSESRFRRLAARQFAAIGIHHDDVGAGTRQADAVDMGGGQFARHDGRGRGGFGRAVAVHQLQAGNLWRPASRWWRPASARRQSRRCASSTDRSVEIRLQQAEIVHRRHHDRVGDALARGDLQIFRRLELGHDDQRCRRSATMVMMLATTPVTCPSGTAAIERSAAVSCMQATKIIAEWMMLQCASIAPLGRPVVPEV